MLGSPRTQAAGVRSIAVAGDVTNSVIVTGDDVTVQLRVDGDDALLADLLAGSRVPTKTPRPRPLDTLPAPSPSHVGREAEAQAVRAALAVEPTLEIHGAADVGKTFLARYALAGGGARSGMPDGIVYVFAKRKSYADILQEIFEAFFACAPPFLAGEQQIRRDLAGVQALVVLDSLDLAREEARELVAALPGCRFMLVAREAPLGEGARLAVGGLALPDAMRLIEQELRRPLDVTERTAAEDVWRRLDGHPFKLRQAAADVRDGTRTFDMLASALAAGHATDALAELLRAELSVGDAAIVAQLAALGDDLLGTEHVTALTGQSAGALAALEARRLIASGSPRFRLAGALAETAAPDEIAVRRVEEHLIGWAAANRSRPANLLAEAPALLALWRRAVDDGRDRDVIALGRAIDAAFAWGRRWGTWGLVLESVLRAARRAGDQAAEAWALHGLGTRAYALGDPAAAVASLTQALQMRERLADRAAEQATRHNLDFIAGPPPPSSGDRGATPPGGGPFAGRGRLVALGLTAAVGAVAAAAIAGQGGAAPQTRNVGATAPIAPPHTTPATPATGAPHRRPGTGHPKKPTSGPSATVPTTTGPSTPPGATQTTPPPASFKLAVAIPTDGGTVTSTPDGISCPGTCAAPFAGGTPVTLTATPQVDGSWQFAGWSGECGASDTCQVTLDQDRTVTATFHSPPINTAAPTISLAPVASVAAVSTAPLSVLKGDPGGWSGVPKPTFTYQWQACRTAATDGCSSLPGQTAPTLPAAVGHIPVYLRVLVTATNEVASTCAASAVVPANSPQDSATGGPGEACPPP